MQVNGEWNADSVHPLVSLKHCKLPSCSVFTMPALDDTARQVPGSKANPLRLNRLLGSRDVCPMALL